MISWVRKRARIARIFRCRTFMEWFWHYNGWASVVVYGTFAALFGYLLVWSAQ